MKSVLSLVVFGIGLALAAPSAAAARPAASLHAAPVLGMAWYLQAFELGPWQHYLAHELTPDLERLTDGDPPRVSWVQFDQTIIVPDFAVAMIGSQQTPLIFSVRQGYAVRGLQDSGNGGDPRVFSQSVVMPGLTRQVSDRNALTVSAVLASQRFGASGMNLDESDQPMGFHDPAIYAGYGRPEVAHGAGLRLALSSELASRLTLEAAYQSRIDMTQLTTLRGIHGSRAELDIPSRLQVGLQLHATSRASFNLGVSQIFYSEVGAFPSRALPARFNALLGDSTSPDFDWNDLTVLSVGWQWQHSDGTQLFIDYRTRSQPRPTAPALADALAPELAQNAFLAGISRTLGERAQLQLNAAYAPPEFAFGGNVLGVVTDKLDQSVEVQATFRVDF